MATGRTFDVYGAAAYLSKATGRTPDQVQINPESVRRAYRSGKLRGTKDELATGKPVRYSQADLDAYVAERVQTNVGAQPVLGRSPRFEGAE